MAIHSGFARSSRTQQIPGCPLAPGGHERACARCPFNALRPGAARVGCALSTPHRTYVRALEQLGRIDAAARDWLAGQLDAQRATAGDEGLSTAALTDLTAIAERWWPLVGNDVEVQQVVAGVLLFSRAALETGEPVRILA